MNIKVFAFIFAICVTSLKLTESAKILGIFTSHSRSHLIVHMAVAKALIDKGHNLTIVTTLNLNDLNPSYRHIKLKPHDGRDSIKTMVETKGRFAKFKQVFGTINSLMKSSDDAIKDPKMIKLMQEDSFDLVLLGYFFNDFHLGLAAHFKCPSVIIWMIQPVGFINHIVGNPSEISHIPNAFSGQAIELGFFERTKNLLFWLVEQAIAPIFYRTMRLYYEDNFPLDKYPSFDEMYANISLVLCNHHFSEGPIRANVPAIIEIGGIQIKPKPDPLPNDIKEFLDSASEYGAIFFSLGSNVHGSDLGANTIEIIFKVLSNLKQKVIWKWNTDDKKPGLSEKILFKNWLPQDDILTHPNVKLFITHGGKGSIVETEYHGVPIVGLPIFGDQNMHIQLAEFKGFGIGLDYQSLTEKQFRESIIEVIENPKYKENIKKYSDLYRDRPMTARETATYWIEYVIRHRGAKHMQSQAIHLNKMQYFMLDVFGFLLVILYVVYFLSKTILKCLYTKLFKSQKKATKTKVQ